MASHRDSSALVTPISSTTDEDSTANTNPSYSSFRNRFSNASLSTLSSVRTFLPQYSVVDTLEEPPTNPSTGLASTSGVDPPHYSLAHHRRSLILTRRASTTTCFQVKGGPQGFRYSYPIRPKKPWATLHLHTRDTVPRSLKPLQSQPRVPKVWSCDPITGTLQLDLDSPQSIQQINILLNGSIIISSHSEGSVQFLGHEFTLWDKSMGDPLESDNTDSQSTQKKPFNGRLGSGQYAFPFSFPFPTHADPVTKSAVLNTSSIVPFSPSPSKVESPSPPLYDYGAKDTEKALTRPRRFISSAVTSSNETPSSSAIPQTFMEKDITPSVTYNISVRIVHGIFKASSKIKTNIAYIPASEPLPASQKRREAYEAGGLLPCPMDDPEGWFALPPATIHGVVDINDNLLQTKVDCTLYIAQPLSYTRGSVIPCFITISSHGVDIEHLISISEMPTARLLRRVQHPMSQDQKLGPEPFFNGSPINSSWDHALLPTSDMKLVTHEVGLAKWWIPSKDVIQGPTIRYLEGEIHLCPDLQPSCDFQLFPVEYAVELLSFQTANFKSDIHSPSLGKSRQKDDVIASSPVEITTLYREDEPVPTTYSELPKAYTVRCVASNKDIVEEGK